MKKKMPFPPAIAPPTIEIPLPQPPSWTAEKELNQKVVAGQVPTAIADAGCITNCNMEFVSEYGEYGLEYQPYDKTGARSDKVFSYAGGGVAAATDTNQMLFNIREPANT